MAENKDVQVMDENENVTSVDELRDVIQVDRNDKCTMDSVITCPGSIFLRFKDVNCLVL